MSIELASLVMHMFYTLSNHRSNNMYMYVTEAKSGHSTFQFTSVILLLYCS